MGNIKFKIWRVKVYWEQPKSSLTLYLIVTNLIVFALTVVYPPSLYILAQINALVWKGAYWQIFTSMFVHFGLPGCQLCSFHLLFNMIALYYFGIPTEMVYGKLRFLVIYFASGLAGNIASLFLLPPGVVSGGASGAIFGLLGAFVAVRRGSAEFGAALSYAIFIFLWSMGPGVNVFAHFFGLVIGFVLGVLFIGYERRKRRRMYRYYGYV